MRLLIAGRVSLARLRLFSRDASRSKKSADCEKNDKSQRSKSEIEKKDYDAHSQEVAKNRCRKNKKICGKTQQKDTCVSSQDDACEKQRERKSESCKSYICPELEQQKPCTWDKERCPEDRNTKGQVSSKNRMRQSRDSNCSQERSTDTRRSESNAKRHNHYYNNI